MRLTRALSLSLILMLLFAGTAVAAQAPAYAPSQDGPVASGAMPDINAPPVYTYQPGEQEMYTSQSLWDLAPFRDLAAPGTEFYYASVEPDSVWRWGLRWCARSPSLLEDMLEPFSIGFSIDGVGPVPWADMRVVRDVRSGWYCEWYATMLYGWTPGAAVTLRIDYSLLWDVWDGQQWYRAGDYSHVMTLDVTGQYDPGPGGFSELFFCSPGEFDRYAGECYSTTDWFGGTVPLLYVSWNPSPEYIGARFTTVWYINGTRFLTKSTYNEWSSLRVVARRSLAKGEYWVELYADGDYVQGGGFTIF
jgi:hypothetical protein